MARSKSVSKKIISSTNPPANTSLPITWYANPYKLVNQEPIQTVHTPLRELLKETIEKWITDFNIRAGLTTNFEDFIMINLSPRGVARKSEPDHVFLFSDYGISRHYMRGYDSAISGNNPFMDEIRMPGLATPEKIITQDLLAFLNGYRDSILDSYVINFTNDEQKQNKPAPEPIDPTTFIDPLFSKLFLDAEKKAIGTSKTFNTQIRCAAFCELLYEKKYILNTKTRLITIRSFAKTKYGLDIKNELAATKKKDRDNNKNATVNKLPPLKNCF